MHTLQGVSDHLLVFLGVQGTHEIAGNSLSEYALAAIIFACGIGILVVARYFVLTWLTSISSRTTTDVDDTFVTVVKSVRPFIIVSISLWLALQVLSLGGVTSSITDALLVILVVYQVVRSLGLLIEEVLARRLTSEDDEATRAGVRLLTNIAKCILWIIGALLILSNFDIDVTSLVAGAGIAGIAIAFALQGVLGELFSSFTLYFDKPFKVGDFIIVGDTLGVVKHIGIKSTRIQSLSGEEITLSNQELTKAKIQNYKRMEERRIVFHFGILYQTPAEKVRQLPYMVRTIVESIEKTRFDRAHFQKFGESSLEFEVVYYVLDPDYTVYMNIQQEINFRLLDLFEKEDLVFAYPTRTLYVNRADVS